MPLTMAETPDRPHRTGAYWLDFLIAVSAVAISCISLWVAQRSDRTQERLLAASVWPYLEYDTSNAAHAYPEIDFEFVNAGVGPARVRWISFEYDGKPMRDPVQFLAACCVARSGSSLQVTTSTITHTVLVPHQSVDFIAVRPTAGIASVFQAVDKSTRHVHVKACYCSVLDDCWMLDSRSDEDPKPVGKCPPAPATAYED